MQTATIGGGFCDVAYQAGQIYVCRIADDVFVERLEAGAFVPVANYPCGGNGFPRLRSVEGSLYLIYRLQNGQMVRIHNLTAGWTREHWGIFYNWPGALGDAGYAVNSLGTGACDVFNYDGSTVSTLPPLPGTGIAYLDGFNRPVSIDDNRGAEGEWGLLNPEFAGAVFCGEGMEGGVACVYQDTTKKVIQPGTITYTPKIAKHGSRDEWAIVTTNYATVSLFYDLTAADFGAVEPPVDPPVEPPVEPPTEPPAYTHVLYLEPGEAVLTTAVARRSGAMLRRL